MSGVRVRETGYVSVVRAGQRVNVSLHSRAVVSCRQGWVNAVSVGESG